jgi:hypothetical protein
MAGGGVKRMVGGGGGFDSGPLQVKSKVVPWCMVTCGAPQGCMLASGVEGVTVWKPYDGEGMGEEAGTIVGRSSWRG